MKDLPEMTIPAGYASSDDRSTEWRVGYVFRWSDPMRSWVRERGTIVIRPGMTGRDAYGADATIFVRDI